MKRSRRRQDVKTAAHESARLPNGLAHGWLSDQTSIIDVEARPPQPLPDELLDRWPHHDDADTGTTTTLVVVILG